MSKELELFASELQEQFGSVEAARLMRQLMRQAHYRLPPPNDGTLDCVELLSRVLERVGADNMLSAAMDDYAVEVDRMDFTPTP